VRNERSPLAGAKATSYGENVVAQRWGADRGCDEALFANTRGELCEGTGANVFLVVDGVLRTPSLDSGCLAGVTRALVCELAAGEPGGIDEGAVPIDDLARASEAFLTSSTRDIHPIAVLDGREIAAPGPRTARLRERWQAMEARTLDP
jgi:branched-chain amino acid aminotransferase